MRQMHERRRYWAAAVLGLGLVGLVTPAFHDAAAQGPEGGASAAAEAGDGT